MSERICANCVCALRPVGRWFRIILSRWPGLLACISHPDAPGQMREVSHLDTCRNFRRKYKPPVRRKPPEPPNDEIRYIALTKGRFAIVDAADYEWLNQYKWCLSSTNQGRCYACHMEGRTQISMHRLIMNAPKGMLVDHINGNGLDNRRCNLRLCTPTQNMCNRRKYGGKSQYKGVFRNKKSGRYYAKISFKRETIYLGTYDEEIEAARAYDRKAIELFGEFAYLNFPEEHGRDRRPAVATGPE
jgi:AP2 domain/HNH endonuclease